MNAAEVHEIIVDAKDAPITAATVYLRHAQVTRSLKTTVQAGLNRVKLDRIGQISDPDSIRVTGVGKASILDVQFKQDHQKIESGPTDNENEIAALRKEYNSLQSKGKSLESQIQVTKSALDLVEKFTYTVIMSPGFDPTSGSGDSVSSWEHQVTSFMTKTSAKHFETTASLMTKLRHLEESCKEVKEQFEEVNNKLLRLSNSSGKSHYELVQSIVVLFRASEVDNIELEVSYVVNGAQWNPTYDIRAFSQSKHLELVYKAKISQNSGEDWKNINLTLSTAKPSVSGNLPQFTAKWTLELASNQPRRPSRKTKKAAFFGAPGSRSGSGDYDGEESFDVDSFAGPAVTVSEGLIASTFSVKSKICIPSDESDHKVTIATIPLKPQFSYTSIPKKSARAYLTALTKNESEFHLLQGPSLVFLDGAFVAKSSLGKHVAPNEYFEVSLGADPSVAVTYNPTQKSVTTSTSSFLVGKKGTVYKYLQSIRIKNNKDLPIQLTLKEQIPLSSESKLTVTLHEPSPPVCEMIATYRERHEEEMDDVSRQEFRKQIRLYQDLNIIEFLLEISNGQEREVTIKYDVYEPEDEDIVGL